MRTISVSELLAFSEGSITVLDVSGQTPRREIRGAVRYKQRDVLAPGKLLLPIDHSKPVIVYGENESEETLSRIGRRLEQEGFKDVRLLPEGTKAYTQQGGDTQETSIEQTAVTEEEVT